MKMYLGNIINSTGRSHNGGFTFVEMLLSFSLFLVLTSFVPIGIHMLLEEGLISKELQKMEWEVFVSQAKKEIRMSDGVFITGDHLSFTMNGQLVTYEKYGSNLRRQVDRKGRELILHEVKTAVFEPVLQGVRISVVDTFEKSYTVVVRTPLKGETW